MKLSRASNAKFFALVLSLLLCASSTLAQKKNKNQQPSDNTPPSSDQKLPMSPGDELDNDIGQMLGALQVGNVDAMHKYYADNATFVSSTYAPPIVGFETWAAGYQRQRAGFSGMQIVRRNTVIFPHGDVAWATYQWEFSGLQTSGAPYSAKGQTTLVFNRVGNNWMIVHNHTSVDCGSISDAGPPAPPTQPPSGPAGAAAPPPSQPKQ
ncbi:MAG: nuclear transport factor 2 family protein [Candidatus Acidiferrales bacterium]|jgi:ketosteroid isomerase-like protein